ncbi:hypothetical protein IQ216_11195 [Cyanobium sp. LEGE 06143]|uniref:hypothetical protein n=1 Tax=Cyanobium sp. LEGE 06143 TaxID=945727 RepID=UPI0018817051|nr:hypothetical protein [Cyanobium sp. LEGE 06143]MBE9173616.1 hypothetical protein [Cyanobium sp. LEGE 06143]
MGFRNQQRHGWHEAIPSTESLVAERHEGLLDVGDCLWRQIGVGLVGHLLERIDTPPRLLE